MRKEIQFNDLLSADIQSYANKYYETNFNMAVRNLVKRGLISEKRASLSLNKKEQINANKS